MCTLNNQENLLAVGVQQALIGLLVLLVLLAAGFHSAGAQEMGKLDIMAGKSILLRSAEQVERVSIADPAIADFVLTSPNEIYITGRTAGVTNMILWTAKDKYSIYDLEVAYDVSPLKQRLHELLPEEKDLRVTVLHDTISLSGRVSSASNLSRALSLARSYAPEGKVQDLVEVRGVQQVMLEVRVAEMQRSLARRLGVNFNYFTESGKFGSAGWVV